MALSVNTSGSQIAVEDSEHDLATITSANVFELNVDVSQMIGGATPDIVEFRVYGKARSTDTERLLKVWTLVGNQSEDLWKSPPIISPHHVRFTITLTQGGGSPVERSFPWAVYQVQ